VPERGCRRIVLTPLRLDDVGQLVADSMRCEPEHARPLAHWFHEKTGGNPFFAIQFFTALAEEDCLRSTQSRQPGRGHRSASAPRTTRQRRGSHRGKLKRFSATTQEAVKRLACLGNIAESLLLTLVHGETERRWTRHSGSRHAGLVSTWMAPTEFLHEPDPAGGVFTDPEERRAELHLRLGRMLLANMTQDELAEHLFDVANQLNRGAALLVERDEKAQVATINLRAGERPKHQRPMRRRACILAAAWPCSAKATGTASTN